jgi:histidinol-phosphatase (PHP family)
VYDYHVHSNYSDGDFIHRMVNAAAEAGLDGVGIADHCAVSERDGPRIHRHDLGFNLDITHERRREAIERAREGRDVTVYDAVEIDYHPDDEAAIRAFLDDAPFDYVVGSVHELDGTNVHVVDHFAAKSDDERRRLVDRYYDRLVSLVESGLADVLAHPDLPERNPALRGFAGEDHYERVARALADAPTVPEVNAGRVFADYAEVHPHPDFLNVLAAHGVPVTVGTDSHAPGEIEPRADHLAALLDERGLDPVRIVE